jgi:hypothetical protein
VNAKNVIENSIQHLLINILKFVKKYFLIKENRSPVKSKGVSKKRNDNLNINVSFKIRFYIWSLSILNYKKMILQKYTSKRKLGKGAYGEVLLV